MLLLTWVIVHLTFIYATAIQDALTIRREITQHLSPILHSSYIYLIFNVVFNLNRRTFNYSLIKFNDRKGLSLNSYNHPLGSRSSSLNLFPIATYSQLLI